MGDREGDMFLQRKLFWRFEFSYEMKQEDQEIKCRNLEIIDIEKPVCVLNFHMFRKYASSKILDKKRWQFIREVVCV